MTPSDLLAIMRLLSAMESWSFAQGKPLPDYLLEQVGNAVEKLEAEILKGLK